MPKTKGSTPAQDWARQRNFAKFRLESVKSHLRSLATQPALLETEKDALKAALHCIKSVSDEWTNRSSTSKAAYLKRNKR